MRAIDRGQLPVLAILLLGLYLTTSSIRRLARAVSPTLSASSYSCEIDPGQTLGRGGVGIGRAGNGTEASTANRYCLRASG